jgi:hypothetical protein
MNFVVVDDEMGWTKVCLDVEKRGSYEKMKDQKRLRLLNILS